VHRRFGELGEHQQAQFHTGEALAVAASAPTTMDSAMTTFTALAVHAAMASTVALAPAAPAASAAVFLKIPEFIHVCQSVLFMFDLTQIASLLILSRYILKGF